MAKKYVFYIWKMIFLNKFINSVLNRFILSFILIVCSFMINIII